MIFNLKKRLALWVQAGAITQTQAQSIETFERQNESQSWVLFGVVAVGLTAVGTGIISIIAANWHWIPNSVKLTSYFSFQLGLGAWVVVQDSKGKALTREWGLFLFSILLFGGIGLISQVFHFHGSFWKALLFWLLISLPAVLHARKAMAHHVWVVIALIALVAWSWDSDVYSNHRHSLLIPCVLLAAPPLLFAVGRSLECWAVRVVPLFQSATQFWGIASLLAVVPFFVDFTWSDLGKSFPLEEAVWLLIPWSTWGMSIAAALDTRSSSPLENRLLAALFGLVGITASMALLLGGGSHDLLVGKVLGATSFVCLWAIAASWAAVARNKRLYDLASLAIACRFISIYFQVFGTLSTTGIGLIVSGALIITVAIVWSKYRHRFAKEMQKGEIQ
jgi:uncharacterized membrane protein